MVHRPLVQDAVALGRLQGLLHPPQLLTSIFTFVSQPLVGSPSQSPKPDAHDGEHLPELPDGMQVLLPCWAVQAALQAPQSDAVLVKFTSQPVSGRPSQSPNPVLQVIEHSP